MIGAVSVMLVSGIARSEDSDRPELRVVATADFQLRGKRSAKAWENARWTELKRRQDGGHQYQTRVKMMYSPTGIYVLMDGADERLTATFERSFEDLWTEDVFEFFLWPDERWPVYFEYEISSLGRELPILIPNFNDQFLGWRPWHYSGQRRTKKRVVIRGGEQKTGAAIKGWRAEVFVPYELLKPLRNVPPKPGTRWRANFYRVDYDGGKETSWDWARVGDSFHEYKKFGTLVFE
jgi:hypothetical protein